MKIPGSSGLLPFARAALVLCGALFSSPCLLATDHIIPDPPKPPASEEVLAHQKLAGVDEAALLRYITEHHESIDVWLPRVAHQEEKALSREYLNKIVNQPTHQELYEQAAAELTRRRLDDPARSVEAALRKLGQSGKPAIIPALAEIAKQESIPWARWKALASIQEIMLRELPPPDPWAAASTLDLALIAPLLRDLPEGQAQVWAVTLWPAASTPAASLTARLWLARHAAVIMPKEAAAVFREGLASPDPTQRTLAAMLLRECLGGSLPHETPGEAMLAKLLDGTAKPTRNSWDVFPKPLEQPLALVHGFTNARTDLIWIDRTGAKLERHSADEVFPGVRHVLPNGFFYSRRGESHPWSIAFTDAGGAVFSRFADIGSMGPPATHGGLWALVSTEGNATEFATDGSVLWECPTGFGDTRDIAPYSAGRVLFLGYRVLECRNRRGDLLWQMDLGKLDDPRDIVATGEGSFLVSCKNSVGTLTQKGGYKPLLENLNSAVGIRYHPGTEWLIKDGGDNRVLVFDPVTKQTTGSIVLEQGPTVKSKFAPDFKLPE